MCPSLESLCIGLTLGPDKAVNAGACARWYVPGQYYNTYQQLRGLTTGLEDTKKSKAMKGRAASWHGIGPPSQKLADSPVTSQQAVLTAEGTRALYVKPPSR